MKCDLFQAFLIYTCGVLANAGNYKGFGDSKIVPNLPFHKFEAIIKNSTAYKNDKITLDNLWNQCKDVIYSLSDNEKSLGFWNQVIVSFIYFYFTDYD